MILVKTLIPIFLLLIIYSCDISKEKIFHVYGNTMGTTYSITIKDSIALSEKKYKIKIDSLLNNINNQFSTYIHNSEINLINNATESFDELSVGFKYVFEKALNYCYLSNGYYDITVYPLVQLWGFNEHQEQIIPDYGDIRNVLRNVGYEKINYIEESGIINKPNDMKIDLNSIAKGYAVDEIYDLLMKDSSISNILLEIGGEIRSYNSSDTDDWVIGIQHPNSNSLIHKIKLNNSSMATSGNYNNYFEKDGIKYSHIINPKNGFPIKHNIVSVTVLSDLCIDADAFATMLMVMPYQDGLNIVNEHDGIECLIVLEDQNEVLHLKYSENFKKYIID